MKKLISVLVLLLTVLALFSNPVKEENGKELTVYAYDTFIGEWGSADALIPLFEEETGIKVNLVSAGSSAEMINKLLMEGDNTSCDVVLGVTDYMAERIYSILEPFESDLIDKIDPSLVFDSTHKLIPFDWGEFAFVWDRESGIEKPESLWDLTKEEYRKKVILIDPRTSSVGLGLLLWTYNALGDDWALWWEKMEDNALVMASGWSSAYALFTEGEAPIVISYTTSPVYHVMNENTTRYEALIFDDGHEVTIEGVGIVKGTEHRKEAEEFISFILTKAQETIAVTNSMYPVTEDTVLPEAYSFAPKSAKIYKADKLDVSSILASFSSLITK